MKNCLYLLWKWWCHFKESTYCIYSVSIYWVLLCARHCFRCWSYSNKENRKKSQSLRGSKWKFCVGGSSLKCRGELIFSTNLNMTKWLIFLLKWTFFKQMVDKNWLQNHNREGQKLDGRLHINGRRKNTDGWRMLLLKVQNSRVIFGGNFMTCDNK
jgi:hypothetical protein